MSLINNCKPWESQGIKKVCWKRGFDLKCIHIDLIVEQVSVKTLLMGESCVFCLNSALYRISSFSICASSQSAYFSAPNTPIGIAFCFMQKDPRLQRIEKFTTRSFVAVTLLLVKTLRPSLFWIIASIFFHVFS
jgi:hypothetical protein